MIWGETCYLGDSHFCAGASAHGVSWPSPSSSFSGGSYNVLNCREVELSFSFAGLVLGQKTLTLTVLLLSGTILCHLQPPPCACTFCSILWNFLRPGTFQAPFLGPAGCFSAEQTIVNKKVGRFYIISLQ